MIRKKVDKANVIIAVFLGIISLISIFPLYHTLVISLSKASDVSNGQLFLIPKSISLSSYKYLLLEGKVTNGLLVSIGITVFGTLLNMLVTTAGAYALSKKRLPGRNIFLNGIIFTMLFSGGLIPYFLTIKGLGFFNSYLVLVLPTLVNAIYFILMKNYFNTIPESLEESAKIDGANDITILAQIILPISKPIIASISLFYAVDRWNEWWMAMMFINDTNKYPLQLVLRNMITNISAVLGNGLGAQFAEGMKGVYVDSAKAAVIIISALPIMCVYPFIQKHFSAGLMLGSIKG
jgi:putative aldouronate transport system permease protein